MIYPDLTTTFQRPAFSPIFCLTAPYIERHLLAAFNHRCHPRPSDPRVATFFPQPEIVMRAVVIFSVEHTREPGTMEDG